MRRVLGSVGVALVLGAAVFLTGCSAIFRPTPTSSSPSVSPYVGTWVLSSVTVGGKTYTGSALQQVNITATLNLNPDTTASLTTMGNTTTGSWKLKNATTITVTMAFIPMDVAIEGNTLVTTLSGATITLKKQ